MPESDIAIYAAVFAGLSAFAGVLASVAAWRSASTAKTVATAQAQGEKRLLAKLAQKILSKAKSLDRLCHEVNSQYDSLAVFTGNLGGSRHKLFKDRIEKSRAEITLITSRVESASLTGESIEEMSEKRVSEILITFTMSHEELMGLGLVLEGEKSELQSELLIHQEKAINNL